jgi:50S ribosomal protein L16 3-hydroxylase
MALWFGQFTTAPKSLDIVVPAEEPAAPEEMAEAIEAGEQLRWNEGSRFAYHDFDIDTALFVDGEQYLLKGDARPLAPLLCSGAYIDMSALAEFAGDEALLGLLTNLYNQGSIYFE